LLIISRVEYLHILVVLFAEDGLDSAASQAESFAASTASSCIRDLFVSDGLQCIVPLRDTLINRVFNATLRNLIIPILPRTVFAIVVTLKAVIILWLK
jgi:hypothetical protein